MLLPSLPRPIGRRNEGDDPAGRSARRGGGGAWDDESKATVPQATLAAVGGFESVVLIAGGRNKGLAPDQLRGTVPPVRPRGA